MDRLGGVIVRLLVSIEMSGSWTHCFHALIVLDSVKILVRGASICFLIDVGS